MFPRKQFGQNFLEDASIIQKIVASINPNKNDHLVEIGPGLGALTAAILPLSGTLDAIEIDRDLATLLKKKYQTFEQLTIFNADALTFDFGRLPKTPTEKIRIFGNLPYNVATPIMLHLLQYMTIIEDLHFMVQKEVAERLVATNNTKDYGRLSVMVQYFCEATSLFEVLPEAFYPRPKVTSMVISLVPRKALLPLPVGIQTLEHVVKIAFNQRRKMLRNSLQPVISAAALEKLGINPQLRAENLTVADFVTIANSAGAEKPSPQ